MVVIQTIHSQDPVITLSFTAVYSGQHVPLDSIRISNYSSGGDTVIYSPDTILHLNAITSLSGKYQDVQPFTMGQNFPNPFMDQTLVNIHIPGDGIVHLILYDIMGVTLAEHAIGLEAGVHSFAVLAGRTGCYLLRAGWRNETRTIKMFCLDDGPGPSADIRYRGSATGVPVNKGSDVLTHKDPMKQFLQQVPKAISIEPPDATAYDEMTLTFDPGEACYQNGSLSGLPYVAMHSGVEFISGDGWQHIVPFDGQGFNGQPPILEPTADGKYSITFTPAEYFGLNGEVVTKICAVFNNGSNWTNEGKDFNISGTGCADFYIPLYLPFQFQPGDVLLYTAFSQKGVATLVDAPVNSTDYSFDYGDFAPCPGTPTVTFAGQTYNTVWISGQCWMKENLNAGFINNWGLDQSDNGNPEKYCYDGDPVNCAIYGGLYQWDEMMQYAEAPRARGLCPPGWHIPTFQEWDTLFHHLGGYEVAGGPLKEAGFLHWASPNTGATNASGFTALPGGYRDFSGNSFASINSFGSFWSSTAQDDQTGSNAGLTHSDDNVFWYSSMKHFGYSVRCIRNDETEGQVAHWIFENNADDQVGNYNPSPDGIVDLAFAQSYKPAAGLCAAFNGTSTIIEIPGGDSLINTPDFTLSFWVKTNSIGHVGANGQPKGHFVIGLAAFYGFQFEISPDYGFCKFAASYELPDGSTAGVDLSFAGDGLTGSNGGLPGWTYCKDLTASGGLQALLKDVWAHVVCTYNSATKEGIMYINGEKMKAQDFDLWPNGDPIQNIVGMKYGGIEPTVYPVLAFGFIRSREGTLWAYEPWGNYYLATSNHFGGFLDNVRIYHVALKGDEVLLLYETEKP